MIVSATLSSCQFRNRFHRLSTEKYQRLPVSAYAGSPAFCCLDFPLRVLRSENSDSKVPYKYISFHQLMQRVEWSLCGAKTRSHDEEMRHTKGTSGIKYLCSLNTTYMKRKSTIIPVIIQRSKKIFRSIPCFFSMMKIEYTVPNGKNTCNIGVKVYERRD